MVACKLCGRSFKPSKHAPNQKYCSPRCQRRAHLDRRKDTGGVPIRCCTNRANRDLIMENSTVDEREKWLLAGLEKKLNGEIE